MDARTNARPFVALAFLAASACGGDGVVGPSDPDQGTPFRVEAALQPLADSVYVLTNAARSQAGAPVLVLDRDLTAVAQSHADDMVRRGYVGHTTPEGAALVDRVRWIGLSDTMVAENLAIDASAARAVDGWMDSQGHRANMVRAGFTRIGIGVKRSADGSAIYFVQLFSG